MQTINDFMANSIFYFAIAIGGWVYLWKVFSRNAPGVAGTAKKAAASRFFGLLTGLFK